MIVLIGAGLAGFVQGLAGFAIGLVAMPFWSDRMAPQVVAPLIALCSLAGQLLTVRTVWAAVDFRRAAPMVAAGLLGIPVGVWLLPAVDAGVFRFWVGVLLCAYCPAMLLAPRLPAIRWGGRGADAAAGLVGGVMGGLAGLSGPAPTLWMTLRGWERDVQRGMIQAFLIVVQAAALVGFAAAGLLTSAFWHMAAWTVPCVFLPSVLGTLLYGRFSADGFRRLVLGLLAVTGVTLVMGL